ncbi:MAG: twin-arginine translocation signal domain-containing protein [Acidobacteria bacterium]|nr:twin-arginine translocation signal domain-containing protein [Acidobacteriota bacterium]
MGGSLLTRRTFLGAVGAGLVSASAAKSAEPARSNGKK